MANSDIRLPRRAQRDLLGEMRRRLVTLERRIRWPGAVQFIEDVGPTGLTAHDIFDTVTFDTFLELELDPGRWLFEAGVSVDHTETSGAEYSIVARLLVNGEADPFGATEVQGDSSATTGNFIDPLCIAATIVLEEQATVEWQIAYVYADVSGGSASARYGYLIAVPQ